MLRFFLRKKGNNRSERAMKKQAKANDKCKKNKKKAISKFTSPEEKSDMIMRI